MINYFSFPLYFKCNAFYYYYYLFIDISSVSTQFCIHCMLHVDKKRTKIMFPLILKTNFSLNVTINLA